MYSCYPASNFGSQAGENPSSPDDFRLLLYFVLIIMRSSNMCRWQLLISACSFSLPGDEGIGLLVPAKY
ncbi:hypothetical protein ACFS7Z_06475 [Pontibacter toksunensis]|uniref:Uncharacterized protein n=1 Tax=Pontibacter toksunensis TaxID=1332631 RepID=A0ABW6BSE2_9BACT